MGGSSWSLLLLSSILFRFVSWTGAKERDSLPIPNTNQFPITFFHNYGSSPALLLMVKSNPDSNPAHKLASNLGWAETHKIRLVGLPTTHLSVGRERERESNHSTWDRKSNGMHGMPFLSSSQSNQYRKCQSNYGRIGWPQLKKLMKVSEFKTRIIKKD